MESGYNATVSLILYSRLRGRFNAAVDAVSQFADVYKSVNARV